MKAWYRRVISRASWPTPTERKLRSAEDAAGLRIWLSSFAFGGHFWTLPLRRHCTPGELHYPHVDNVGLAAVSVLIWNRDDGKFEMETGYGRPA
jgi:hypothetical protein